MDFIYGEICEQAEKNTYTGGDTDTAEVYVDNSSNVIRVVAHADTSYVQGLIDDAIGALDYNDLEQARKFVTQVTETDGKIAVTRRKIVKDDLAEVTFTVSDVAGLGSALNAKQDALGFEGAYDKTSNKVVTREYLEEQVEPLSGSIHFLGTSLTSITEGSTVTRIELSDHTIVDPVTKGDVVSDSQLDIKWFFTGTIWTKYQDNTRYAIKGQIVNTDISSTAEIAQTKITGLRTTNQNGYLDKVDILLEDESTPGSIANSIKTAIESLDYADTEVAHQFVVEVDEADGKISVQRRALDKTDIPTIEQAQVNGLGTSLTNLGTRIDNLNYAEVVLDAGNMDTSEVDKHTAEVLWKISETGGVISVTKRYLTSNDIPSLSYLKITGLASVAHSGSYLDLSNRPTIVYSSASHSLTFNLI